MFDETNNNNNNNYYYTLSIEPYLNTHTKQYQNIIVVDNMPTGPLQKYVTRYMPQKLSPFYDVNETIQCKYAIIARQNKDFVTDADLPALLSFLNSNGYTVDSQTTKVVQKSTITHKKNFVCIFTYTL
jgi:hypothetical protein